jgi:hypothetical protein
MDAVVIFDSARVSVRYRSREDAAWLARLIDTLIERGAFPGCPGYSRQFSEPVEWHGDLGDDCSAVIGDLFCHAEHSSGPIRGGLWYCSVSQGSEQLFNTANCGIEPRSGEAARWLCELIVSAVLAGICVQ